MSATVDHPLDRAWSLLRSPEGQALWIGPGADLVPEKGAAYRTGDGTVGEVRSVREGDRIRLTMRPAGWDHDTTVQVTVSRSGPVTFAPTSTEPDRLDRPLEIWRSDRSLVPHAPETYPIRPNDGIRTVACQPARCGLDWQQP